MNPLHIYPNAGVYSVTHIVTTAGGCSDTIVQNILVGAPPQANFNIIGACQGDTIQFQNQSNTLCSFSWNFMDGSPNSNQANPQHIYTATGNYNVSLIATNPIGCIDTSYQNLTIQALPTINAGNDTIIVQEIVFRCLRAVASNIIGNIIQQTARNSIQLMMVLSALLEQIVMVVQTSIAYSYP